MAAAGLDRPIKLSVFDRLVTDRQSEGAIGSANDVSKLRETVRRDLEWLLNTRRIYRTAPDDFPAVQRSLYHYGLPDITSLGRDNPDTRAKLLAQLEETIKLFEPRLTQVRIVPAKEAMDGHRRLRFVIHAMLDADPEPVRVVFDTAVDRGNGAINVHEDEA